MSLRSSTRALPRARFRRRGWSARLVVGREQVVVNPWSSGGPTTSSGESTRYRCGEVGVVVDSRRKVAPYG